MQGGAIAENMHVYGEGEGEEGEFYMLQLFV